MFASRDKRYHKFIHAQAYKEDCTRTLQRIWRGVLGRKAFSQVRESQVEVNAVIKMQALARGFLVRAVKKRFENDLIDQIYGPNVPVLYCDHDKVSVATVHCIQCNKNYSGITGIVLHKNRLRKNHVLQTMTDWIKDHAATKIQAQARVMLAKRNVAVMRAQHQLDEHATLIQALCKGHRARLEFEQLRHDIQTICVHCRYREGRPAVVHCHQCDTNLCKVCNQFLHMAPKRKKHERVEFSEEFIHVPERTGPRVMSSEAIRDWKSTWEVEIETTQEQVQPMEEEPEEDDVVKEMEVVAEEEDQEQSDQPDQPTPEDVELDHEDVDEVDEEVFEQMEEDQQEAEEQDEGEGEEVPVEEELVAQLHEFEDVDHSEDDQEQPVAEEDSDDIPVQEDKPHSEWEDVVVETEEQPEEEKEEEEEEQGNQGPVELELEETGPLHISMVQENLSNFPIIDASAADRIISLDLSMNNISVIDDDAFVGMVNLETLDLSGNQLKTLPSSLYGLANLRELNISDNQLSRLHAFKNLVSLESVNLSGNGLEIIPRGLSLCQNLMVLEAASNHLGVISKEIIQLNNLQRLHLGSNSIDKLPKELFALGNLEDIDLSNNELTVIPVEIGQLEGLRNLNLSSNFMSSVPAELVSLPNMKRLAIADNKLEEVPDAFNPDAPLQQLDLSANAKLEFIPESLAHVEALSMLMLADCNLLSLPRSLANLPMLTAIVLNGNNNLPYPKKILHGSVQELQEFLKRNKVIQLNDEEEKEKSVLDNVDDFLDSVFK
eukprot:TRINITY_DN4463_c0_g2_i1.p2 TRINITY_DN4463_c0_g2~~TRINITY_DN4463_c0_g2_i1.p2  ORF type:complete len:775 (-),score=308.79 TRINITY_DN4463_c0_g2_i1:223-2547(-)